MTLTNNQCLGRPVAESPPPASLDPEQALVKLEIAMGLFEIFTMFHMPAEVWPVLLTAETLVLEA